MTDWYSAAREADGRTDEEIMAEIKYRADTGAGTPLTAEDITNLSEVVESQARLGHPMTIVPNDVLVRLLDAARSRSATDPAGLDVEPCPFCAADRPGAVGAGCMECRGRGTVGPAFRRNRGLPPLARLSVADKEPS